jgi:ubiquitin-protein ligase
MQNNTRSQKRLQKEIEDLQKFEDTFKLEIDDKTPTVWKVSFKGAEGTVFAGEPFTLQFKFSAEYVRCTFL